MRLRKERFPSQRRNKLIATAEGTFNILERIGDSTFKLELPWETTITPTFNLGDLVSFLDDKSHENLRDIYFQAGEDDAGTSQEHLVSIPLTATSAPDPMSAHNATEVALGTTPETARGKRDEKGLVGCCNTQPQARVTMLI